MSLAIIIHFISYYNYFYHILIYCLQISRIQYSSDNKESKIDELLVL